MIKTILCLVFGLLVYLGIGCGCAIPFVWIAVRFGDGEPLFPSELTVLLWPGAVPLQAFFLLICLISMLFERVAQMMKEEYHGNE